MDERRESRMRQIMNAVIDAWDSSEVPGLDGFMARRSIVERHALIAVTRAALMPYLHGLSFNAPEKPQRSEARLQALNTLLATKAISERVADRMCNAPGHLPALAADLNTFLDALEV